MINQPAAPDETMDGSTPAAGTDAHDAPLDQALAAARWLAARPVAVVPAAAAVLAAAVIGVLSASLPAAAAAAVIAAVIAWLVMLRTRRASRPARAITGLPGTGYISGGNGWPATVFRTRYLPEDSARDTPGAMAAARPPLSPPHGVPAALRLADEILAGLRPGPEQVTAADPDTTAVRWDTRSLQSGAENNLPGHRADKMHLICGLVRDCARGMGVLHQLPQILLTADDGAVIELFGTYSHGRTGTLAGSPAAWPGRTSA